MVWGGDTFAAAPDVVYAYVPLAGEDHLTISLCGSAFDTELSDVVPGSVLYVVIDGHDGAHGEYQLRIESGAPCDMPCPDGLRRPKPSPGARSRRCSNERCAGAQL